jgi:hypothetical protein
MIVSPALPSRGYAERLAEQEGDSRLLPETADMRVDGIQRLVPPPDGGDDGVRGLAPAEGPWFGVGLGDEAVDGFLERDDGVKDAAWSAWRRTPRRR